MGVAPQPAAGGAMTDLATPLLDRTVAEATGLVALRYLDAATAAASRLTDRTDAEALHDFRVALRRLRVTVRAYPDLREAVAKKYRRRLRKLARETNAIRDAEAQIAWFRDHTAQFTPPQRAALAPLRSRLRSRRRRAQVDTHVQLQSRFAKIERKIRRSLTTLLADDGRGKSPFRVSAAATLVAHAKDLRERLEPGAAGSAAELHATRIAAKRLRYLLEPVEQDLEQGARLTGRLKQLQDVFGGLTDAHELQGELRRAATTDQETGVTAAFNLLDAEVAGLLATVREDWSSAGVELEKEVIAAARQLSSSRAPRVPPSRRHRAARRRSRIPA